MEGLTLVKSTRLNNAAKETSSTASTSIAEVKELKKDITDILNNSDDDISKMKAARERMLKFYNNNK